jgi:hypothetical protein
VQAHLAWLSHAGVSGLLPTMPHRKLLAEGARQAREADQSSSGGGGGGGGGGGRSGGGAPRSSAEGGPGGGGEGEGLVPPEVRYALSLDITPIREGVAREEESQAVGGLYASGSPSSVIGWRRELAAAEAAGGDEAGRQKYHLRNISTRTGSLS